MKAFRRIQTAAVLAPLLFVTACGQAQSTTHPVAKQVDIGSNSPFQVRLNQEVGTLDPLFDATATKVSTVRVLSWNGTPETIHISSTPVAFVAYWCPHCQRFLTLLQNNWSTIQSHPAIVATGFTANTTLAQAKTLFHQEENALHFHFPHSDVYFLVDTAESQRLVQAYPELYFTKNQKVLTLIGEHELSIWKKALS